MLMYLERVCGLNSKIGEKRIFAFFTWANFPIVRSPYASFEATETFGELWLVSNQQIVLESRDIILWTGPAVVEWPPCSRPIR